MAVGAIETLDEKAEPAEVRFVQTLTINLLQHQFKEVTEVSVLKESAPFTMIFDGKNGWIKGDGKIVALEKSELVEAKNMSMTVDATHLLTPLLDKQKYKLTAIRMAFVDGKRASEIRVSREGFQDLTLFFDYKTNLLVKMERKALRPQGGECQETRLYKAYQKTNGRLVPGSITLLRNEELVIEMHVVDYTILNEIDPSEFVRPKE
jgi:hypothetical protein